MKYSLWGVSLQHLGIPAQRLYIVPEPYGAPLNKNAVLCSDRNVDMDPIEILEVYGPMAALYNPLPLMSEYCAVVQSGAMGDNEELKFWDNRYEPLPYFLRQFMYNPKTVEEGYQAYLNAGPPLVRPI